jgi:hypothetical protein
MMETIAVYWEPIIRTYGFHELEGLVLCQTSAPPEAAGQWGRMFQALPEIDPAFRLVWAQSEDGDRITLFMLCDRTHWRKIEPFWPRHAGQRIDGGDPSEQTVDLVYFQGPHFGDRYGIMDFTYKALARGKVPLLSAACSVATIYLVFPAGWGSKARVLLSAAFEIPVPDRKAKPGGGPGSRDAEP